VYKAATLPGGFARLWGIPRDPAGRHPGRRRSNPPLAAGKVHDVAQRRTQAASRRRLLDHVKEKDEGRYQKIIERLGIRR
jgi:hypothetical protein